MNAIQRHELYVLEQGENPYVLFLSTHPSVSIHSYIHLSIYLSVCLYVYLLLTLYERYKYKINQIRFHVPRYSLAREQSRGV